MRSVDRIVPRFRFTFGLNLEICGKNDAAACKDVDVYLDEY